MSKPLNILMLEDNASDAELAELKLQELDFPYELAVVSNRKTFEEKVNEQWPGLVLTDYNVPGFQGDEALEYILEHAPATPFLFITGTLGEEKAVEMIKQGATDFILKNRLVALPRAIYRALRLKEEKQAHKEATDKLVENEVRYRSLIENIYDAILIQDENTLITYASPAVKSILGYEPEELIGQPAAASIHPDDVPLGASLYEKLITGKEKVVKLEERVKKKDGNYIWVHATMSDCRNVPGINGIVSNFKNIDEEKKARDEVKQSEEKLTQVTNAIPGAVYRFILKEDGSQFIDFLSPGIENITGYKPEEYDRDLMQLLPKLVHEADADQLLSGIIQSAEKIAPLNLEFRTFHKKGHPVWVKVQAIPTVEPATHNVIWNGILTDISKEMEMDRKLKESNALYQSLFEHSPTPKFVHDRETQEILHVNQKAVEFYGYSREEFLQMKIKDLLPENERAELEENLEQFENEERSVFYPTHQTKNKKLVETQVNVSKVRYKGKKAAIAVVTDLTEIKKAERKLRFDADILNNVTNSVIATDLEGKIIYWNQGAEQIFGYTEEEMQGATTAPLHPEENAEEIANDLEEILAGKAYQGVWEGRRKDQSTVWINIRTTVMKDANGQPQGFIGVSSDISSLIEAEEEKTKLLHNLNERVKEQSLLYKVSTLFQQYDNKNIGQIMKQVALLLHEGWQYPDQTVARIIFDGEEYSDSRFMQTQWKQEAQFTTHSGKKGKVQVFYIQQMPEMDEGPFIKEERALINSLTEMVQNWLEKKHAEKQLKKTLDGLEVEVEERTRELKEANFLLKSEVRERKWVTNELEEEKKAMMQSIAYAQRMQKAIFPSRELFERYFKGVSLFFNPRDGVSGDFPWMHHSDKQSFFSAADCTGHGVPGALLSMIANELLNHIVVENEIHSPASVLQALNNSLNFVLKADTQTGLQDGVDLAFCSFDHETYKLHYAGAYNSCYVISNGDLTELKANRCSVGGNVAKNIDNEFIEYTVQLEKGDVVYVFSDGYVDQFGGPKNKKFMKKRFMQLLKENSHRPMSEQKALLKKTFIDWMGSEPQIDDVLVLGVKV